ncbi:BTB/POZ fold domain-containing protein [Strongyloides ratti]|uniref:BTB/POZ fold domain-containing protein n=1 Tax=Strongyloides ratti TaxID=34506 RepID=A0A090L4B4_STRRB|nr:BTB/POZ fold domain-containing protein [Strongyloides ratti]CEF62309.1 BTB/POZ fold domain-containing protein [Strongyloides ratti]
MSKQKWTNLINLSNIDVSLNDISLSYNYLCYDINLEIKKKDKENINIIITSKPQFDEVYHLLIHYQLLVNGKPIHVVMDDFWNGGECELINCLYNNVMIENLKFELEMVEIKSSQNLKEKSSLRNFQITVGGEAFFVNINQLEEYGGALFKAVDSKVKEGKTGCEFNDLLPSEFRILMDALFTYNSLNINRRNYLSLLYIASTLKSNILLRSLEGFLISSQEVHPIRKLEHAVSYRMARLADSIVRSYENNKVKMLEDLHRYMEQNNETLEEQHPMILQIFDIGNNHVIIN